MGLCNKIIEGFKDLWRNRYPGMAVFYLHRITGVAITVFLCLHIWTLSTVFRGKFAYDYAITKFDTTAGYILQYVLLLAIAVHLLNGIRITITDFYGLSRSQKKILWVSSFVFCLIAAIGVFTVLI